MEQFVSFYTALIKADWIIPLSGICYLVFGFFFSELGSTRFVYRRHRASKSDKMSAQFCAFS
jgi:hypothetical protein